MKWPTVAPLFCLLSLLSGCQLAPPKADLIVQSGRILTSNPAQPQVSAVAVRGGKIVALGSNAHIQQWQGAQTEVIDLGGKMALPGLLDSHLHSIEGALALDACSMDDEKLGLAELTQRIRQCAAQQPGNDWLQVLNVRSVGTELSRQQLDQILPERPLFVVSTDAHTAWVNSLGLQMAGVTASTVAPDNGKIGLDDSGQLSGVLLDGATALVSKVIPDMPLDQRVSALSRVISQLHAAGITGYLEANSNAASITTFCAMAAKGLLNAHVTISLGSDGQATDAEFTRLDALRQQARDCGVQADTIKLFADGVMEYPTQTAALTKPYLDLHGHTTGNTGPLYLPDEQLKRFSTMALQRGFSLHVHAIGDGAVHEVLDAFAYARAAVPDSPARLSMAHLQLIEPADYARFAELDVLASLQLLWAQPDEYSVDAVRPYIGDERHQRLYPAASLRNAGATIAGGSDWNVSTFNPFAAMAVGRGRTNLDHPEAGSLNANEALSLTDLLQAYTHNAAILMGQQQQIGQLKVGMNADLIVLSSPLDESSSAADIAATQVVLTVFQGRVVYGQP